MDEQALTWLKWIVLGVPVGLLLAFLLDRLIEGVIFKRYFSDE